MMSFYHPYSGFVKECGAENMFREAPNALQWNGGQMINQNKQIESRSLVYYNEIPRDDQEQAYNWYQTVPLTHDGGYAQDLCAKENIQEQFNRKGRLLNERQKRYRTSFTTFQLGRLEEEFQKDMYAVGMKRMRLAGELNLTEKQIKVWFQNRRMKYKRVCQRLHNRRMAVNKLWAE